MRPSPQDVELAVDLVVQAGRLAARMRRAGVTTSTKTSLTDVVTDADRAAEELLAGALARHRPDDGLLGEEGAERVGRSGRRWVVDPVDGTYNFVRGLDLWCCAIALAEQDQVLLGAVHHPASDTVWVGGPELPTTRNGTPLPPLVDVPLNQASLATYLHPPRLAVPEVAQPFTALAGAAASLHMLGSGSLELAYVADGAIGLYAHHDNPPWDWLPGQALVLGAGGAARSVDVAGHRWDLAGSAAAVEQGVQALRTAQQ